MKALLFKDWQLMTKNWILFVVVMVVVALLSILMSVFSISGSIVFFSMAFGAWALVTMFSDNKNGWNKIARSMPIPLNKIVLSKLILTMLAVIAGMVLGTIIAFLYDLGRPTSFSYTYQNGVLIDSSSGGFITAGEILYCACIFLCIYLIVFSILIAAIYNSSNFKKTMLSIIIVMAVLIGILILFIAIDGRNLSMRVPSVNRVILMLITTPIVFFVAYKIGSWGLKKAEL